MVELILTPLLLLLDATIIIASFALADTYGTIGNKDKVRMDA
jgi:hypothetical protein